MTHLSRRTLFLGAGALGLTGCALPPVNITRPTNAPTGTVASQLDQVAAVYATNTEQLGISVLDLRSNNEWGFKGEYSSQSASMAKVMIVALALRTARAQGHALAFEQQTDASNALINSDNDSADRLWRYVGGNINDTSQANLDRAADAYQRLANELEMTSTTRDPNRPDWSWTHTTPHDQVVLLQKLLGGTDAILTEDRLYELDIMRKTNPSQIWGVGSMRSSEVAVQMKDGWVQFTSTDGLWAVNSMGHVEGEGRNYLAAMMCRMPTFAQGRTLLNNIGQDIFRVLGTGTI